MALKFEDYYDGENRISAAIITNTEDAAIVTISGDVVHVSKGSVVVATAYPGMYDVHSKSSFASTGYAKRAKPAKPAAKKAAKKAVTKSAPPEPSTPPK